MFSLSKTDQYSFMHQVVWTEKNLSRSVFSAHAQLCEHKLITSGPGVGIEGVTVTCPCMSHKHSFPRIMASWGSCSIFASSWWGWRKTRWLEGWGSNPCAESKISCDARGAARAIWTALADAVGMMGLCLCCYLWHPGTSLPLQISHQ